MAVGRQRDLDPNIEKDATMLRTVCLDRQMLRPEDAALFIARAVRLAPCDSRRCMNITAKAKHEQRRSDGDVRPLHSVRNRCLSVILVSVRIK